MTDNLKKNAVKAAVWRMIEMLSQRAGTLVVSIVLARLLLPEQFGTVAMLSIFLQIARVFINAGFGQALIQKKDTTLLEESSVFYCNIAMAILLYGVLYFLAPFVPVIYDKPGLMVLPDLLRVAAISLIIGSASQVHSNLLQKRLHFKPLSLVSIYGLIVQGAVGISMAYMGYGVWALVFSELVSVTFRTVLLWFLFKWRPGFIFSFSALKPLFGFGSKVLLTGILDVFFVQVYGLLIGRFYTPADLAFYNRGKSWPYLISTSLNSTVSSVLFPVLSTIQDDVVRIRRALKKAQTTITFLLWPLLVGMAVVAEPLVLVVLGEKWLAAVPYMRILCLQMSLYPLHSLNLQLLMAKGQSSKVLRLEIIKKSLTCISLIVTVPLGIMTMVYGGLVCSIIALVINTYYTNKLVGYSFWKQLIDLLPVGGITMLMAAAVWGMTQITYPLIYLGLIAEVSVGAVVYLFAAYFFKLAAFDEVCSIVLERLGKLKR